MMDTKKLFSYNINPYALAEQVVGKPIDWAKAAEPGTTLAQIFHVPAERLFAENSPLLTPNTEILPDGTIQPLDHAAAKLRLKKFLAENSAPMAAPCAAPAPNAAELPLVQAAPDALFDTLTGILYPEGPADAPGAAAPEKKGDWRDENTRPSNTVWRDCGKYFTDMPEFDDPVQGGLGDCYFIAALTSLAWTRQGTLQDIVRVRPLSGLPDDGQLEHRIQFYNAETKAWDVQHTAEVTLVDRRTGRPVFARSKDAGEIWPSVMEEAYAMWRCGTYVPDYRKIEGGLGVYALRDLMGGEPKLLCGDSFNVDNVWGMLTENSTSYHTGSGDTYVWGGKNFNPMTAGTRTHLPREAIDMGLVARHAYSVLGFEYRANPRAWYVILRNPWGTHPATGNVRTGNWEFDASHNYLELGKNGVFALEFFTFMRYYDEIGVVK